MCGPIIGGAALGGALGLFNGIQSRKANKKAAAAAEEQRNKAEQQYNEANQKQPDLASIFTNVKKDVSKGLGGTFLTGPSGVEGGSTPLGGASLLGG